MTDGAFIICAVTCLLAGALIVSRRHPVYSVVFMLPFFLGMTGLFVLLSAAFLAAIQMIVYGGAILVVFLFVIMLLNLKTEELRDDFPVSSYVGSSFGAALLGTVLIVFVRRGISPQLEDAFAKPLAAARDFGSIKDLALPLFREQIVPFELASVLIVVAILGAVLLSKRKV